MNAELNTEKINALLAECGVPIPPPGSTLKLEIAFDFQGKA